MTTTEVRSNVEVEGYVIGLALCYAPALETFVGELDPTDFYRPGFASAFAAIVRLHQNGHRVDPVTLADTMGREGTLESLGGLDGLLDMRANAIPSGVMAREYVVILRRESTARKLEYAMLEARTALADQSDPVGVAELLESRIQGLDRAGKLPERFWASTDDYMAEDHSDTTAPLAEGVCYPHSRIMVIASEKLGKSVVLKQIAFCLAAGIHPFNPRIVIDPVRVLIFDAENEDDELESSIGMVRASIDRTKPDAPRPAMLSMPFGADLTVRRDRTEIQDVIESVRPQLIVGGPVYKMTDQTQNLSEDRRAAIVQSFLSDIRRRWGCAVMLEHHAPTGDGHKKREIKAKGGQVWPAWLNLTITLHAEEEGMLARVGYQHPPRGKFRWPRSFRRSTRPGEWPWVPILRQADVHVGEAALPIEEQPF